MCVDDVVGRWCVGNVGADGARGEFLGATEVIPAHDVGLGRSGNIGDFAVFVVCVAQSPGVGDVGLLVVGSVDEFVAEIGESVGDGEFGVPDVALLGHGLWGPIVEAAGDGP